MIEAALARAVLLQLAIWRMPRGTPYTTVQALVRAAVDACRAFGDWDRICYDAWLEYMVRGKVSVLDGNSPR